MSTFHLNSGHMLVDGSRTATAFALLTSPLTRVYLALDMWLSFTNPSKTCRQEAAQGVCLGHASRVREESWWCPSFMKFVLWKLFIADDDDAADLLFLLLLLILFR